MTIMEAVGTGVALTLLLTISAGIAKFAYDRIISEVERNRQEIERNNKKITRTSRVADTALSSVYGNDDRPEDEGFIVESREKYHTIDERVQGVEESIDRLEKNQRKHNDKMGVIVDAIAEELGVEIPAPDGGKHAGAGGE